MVTSRAVDPPLCRTAPASKAAGACPVTLREDGRCPVQDFELPSRSFQTHPGGEHHLQTAKDSDCAGLMFMAYHMGLDLDWKIPAVAAALGIRTPEHGPFFEDVHALVRRVRAEHGPRQHRMFVSWCLLITCAIPVVFVWFYVAPDVWNSFVLAFLFDVYFLNVFHTRHHKGGKLYGLRWLDSALRPFYDFVDNTWGYNVDAWIVNHHAKHHMYTNDEERDPDVPATYPAIRNFVKQDRYFFHAFQSIYWCAGMAFSTMRFPLQNLFEYSGPKAFFVAWFVFTWFIPLCLHGTDGLRWAFFMQALNGYMLTYKFGVSHTHPDLPKHGDDHDAELKKWMSTNTVDGWMANQVEESMSWGGYWMTLIYGGINLQIEHHVAPALDPPLLWFMADGMEHICKKHGIRYTREPSWGHAVYRFHQRLWTMGFESSEPPRDGCSSRLLEGD
jgi:fatty acid desaturase